MKSVKPGRGPSKLSFAGSIVTVVFGIFWTIAAFAITGSMRTGSFGMGPDLSIIGYIFPLFGVVFVIIGIVQAVYHHKNATGKERYSLFDVVDSQEEGDPASPNVNFCAHCGAKLPAQSQFCPQCGNKVTE